MNTKTQQRTARLAAERHGRMMGRLFALEIIGFSFILALELLHL